MIRARRFFILLGLLALAALAMGQESCDTSTEEGEAESGSGGGKLEVAGVGDKLTLKGTTYTVTNASTKKQLGESEFDTVKANGTFIVVKLTLTNRKDEPATILEDNIRLIGGNGKNYSTSDDALLVVADQNFILEEIQPDVTEKGTLVYDVPPNALEFRRFWA